MLRRFRQIFVVLVVLFAIYLVLGFLLVPSLLRSKGLPLAQERLIPTLTVERIQFNPLTLSLTVRGMTLTGEEAPQLAKIGEVYVNLSAASVIRLHPVVSEIRLRDPQFNLARRPDGSLNWAEIMAPTEAAAEPEETTEGGPVNFTLKSFTIIDGIVTVEDTSLGETFTQQLGPINFSLLELDSTSAEPGEHEFTATTPEGGVLQWTGNLKLYPLVCEGALQFDGLAVHRASPYLATHLGWESTSASLSWNFSYKIDLSGSTPVLRIEDGQLALSELALKQKGASESFFELAHLQVSDLSTDLTGRSTTVGKIVVASPVVRASRGAEGAINLLPAPAAAEDEVTVVETTPPSPAEPAAAWQWSIGDFELKEGRIDWNDAAVTPTTALTLYLDTLAVGRVTSDLTQSFPVRLAARIGEEAALSIEGELAPSPLTGDLELVLSAFDPGLVGAYWSPAAGLDWKDGRVSTETTVALRQSAAGTLAVRSQSDAKVEGLELIERKSGETLAQGTLLEADAVVFDQAEERLQISRVLLDGMQVNLQRNADGDMNLPGGDVEEEAAVVVTEDVIEPVEVATEPAEPGLRITIDRVELANNQIAFSDRVPDPAVAIRLENFGGTIENIDSDPTARAELDLGAQVQGVSRLSVKGTLNPFPEALFVDLKVVLDTADLTLFSPYSAQFLGRKIAKGNLSLEVDEAIEDRILKGDHVVTLDQFEWGEKVDAPDAPSLPLDLAVTLFKDMNGVIKIDLPVQGDLDDPAFSYGGLIFQVFGNLLSKAATAPFRFLASTLLPKGADPSTLQFAPGSAEIPGDATTIGYLVTMHDSRPLISFELQGRFSEADLEQLRASAFEEKILEEWEKMPGSPRPPLARVRGSILRRLAGETKGEVTVPELEAAVREAIDVTPAALALARARSETAQAALIAAGIQAEALFLLEPATNPAPESTVSISYRE